MLASGTQDRGFAPDRSRRIFPDVKIHSMPSFGRGSKIICPMLVTRTTKKVKKVKTVNYGKKVTDAGFVFVVLPLLISILTLHFAFFTPEQKNEDTFLHFL
jgi:hypothetical protein